MLPTYPSWITIVGAQFLSKITTYIACQLAISMCMNESALSVKYLIWIRGGLYYYPGANNGQSKGKAGQEQQLVSNLKLPLIGKGTFHPGWFLPTIQISEEVLDLKKFGLLKVLLVFPESSKTHLILPNSIVT